jgi:hypothetical protein
MMDPLNGSLWRPLKLAGRSRASAAPVSVILTRVTSNFRRLRHSPQVESAARVSLAGAVMSLRQIADGASAIAPAPDKLLRRGK